MITTAEPVLLEARDIKQSARVLARAFHDDPGVVWILPREGPRRRLLCWNFEVFLRYGHRFGEAYCTPETLEAAAIWLPPSEPHFSVWRLARLGYLTAVFKLDPWALIRYVATMAKLERLHERDAHGPHWYLAVLGVDPPRQGLGVGGSIIQPVLRRAEMEGLPTLRRARRSTCASTASTASRCLRKVTCPWAGRVTGRCCGSRCGNGRVGIRVPAKRVKRRSVVS